MSGSDSGNLRARVTRGGFILIVRQIALVILSVTGVLVTTRIIGPENYGIYVTALSIHTFIGGVVGLGIQAYLIRGTDRINDRACDIASTSLLLMGLVCGFAEATLVKLYGAKIGIGPAVPFLVVMACALPIQLICAPATARLDRQFNYGRVAAVDLGALITYYVLATVLAFNNWGAWALATGWVAQQIVGVFGYHISAKWMPRPSWDWRIVREMIGYSFSWATSNWIWQARALVNPLIIGNILGVEAVGFVNLAQRLVETLCFTRPIVWRVAMAAFARVQNEPKKLTNAIEDGMELQALAIGPPLVLFAVFGKDLVGTLFGVRWLPAFGVFPFLALASFGIALFTLHSSALAVYKRNLDVVVFNVIQLSIFAAGTYVLLPWLGITAIGVADVVALCSLIVLDWSVRRRIEAVSYFRALPTSASVAFALLLSPVTHLSILLLFLPLIWPSARRRIVSYVTAIIRRRQLR
jgi:O-antigen/teichoic acid export membrane protein